MTTTTSPSSSQLSTADTAAKLVNGLISIKPLWNAAKWQARNRMIKRAETLGVPWRETVQEFQSLDLQHHWDSICNPNLCYPEYYQASFHGYDEGHLCWDAAFEFEVASNTVHATLYPDDAKADNDARLRYSYHDVLDRELPYTPETQPHAILDLHCTVGLDTSLLHQKYPRANVTGLDFSPYYVTVAHYQQAQRFSSLSPSSLTPDALAQPSITWVHALPEQTGLASQSFDWVSAFLLFHEMPQDATRKIFREVRRLVKPGGYFTFMDMNPQAAAYSTMAPYIMALLKSTEPFMDQYFALDIEQELRDAGFDSVTMTVNSIHHRTVVAHVPA